MLKQKRPQTNSPSPQFAASMCYIHVQCSFHNFFRVGHFLTEMGTFDVQKGSSSALRNDYVQYWNWMVLFLVLTICKPKALIWQPKIKTITPLTLPEWWIRLIIVLLYRHECFTGKYTTHKIHKNYIRDPSGLFSIISHVSLSIT